MTRFSANIVRACSERFDVHARQLVRDLGANDYRTRERASGQLVRMGSAVEPILREGLAAPDPEVRSRCRHILPQHLRTISIPKGLLNTIRRRSPDCEAAMPVRLRWRTASATTTSG